MLGRFINTRALLNSWAPPRSRRRKALWKLKWFAMNWTRPMVVYRHLLYSHIPWKIQDLYDPEILEQFLYRAGVKGFARRAFDPAASPAAAAGWVLQQLLAQPQLRSRSRSPLREGISGAFGQGLLQQLEGRPQAQANVTAAFAEPPGQVIPSMIAEYENWRNRFPLALTPEGRGLFLHHLLSGAMNVFRLPLEAVLWFHFDAGEDPSHGLVPSYQVQPSWQQAHPAALTPAGWRPFTQWLREKYQIREEWIDTVPPPVAPSPATQSLLQRLQDLRDGRVQMQPRPFGVNLLAHFRYPSGLQEAAFATVEALQEAEVPIALRDVTNNHKVDRPGRQGYLDLELFDVSVSCVPPQPLGEIRFDHAGLWRREGLYRIANWYWELETIPAGWVEQLQYFQEFWAPTRFIRDAFARVAKIPVTHVAAGIRLPQPTGLTRAHLGLPEGKFLFLFMFDMSSVLPRKNPLAVVEAFRKSVGVSREVRLVIKTSRGDCDPFHLRQLQDACKTVDAILIDRVLTRRESYGLLENCDAYVSLHRSEGYGLTMAEAMSYGKPVIATNYSGNLDFMTPENSWLIPYAPLQLRQDHHPYPKGATWADADTDAAAAAIRELLASPARTEAKARLGQAHVREVLSLRAYGQRLRARLEAILG